MRKFKSFLIVCLALIIASCRQLVGNNINGSTSENDSTDVVEIVMSSPVQYLGDDFEVTIAQIDSICNADTLPNFDSWLTISFRDDETNKIFQRKMCIKYMKNKEIVYTITVDNAEPYSYTKRITKE